MEDGAVIVLVMMIDMWKENVYSPSATNDRPMTSLDRALDIHREMLQTIAGTPEQYTSISMELVSGGAVFADASDPYSGLNPAWRKSYFNAIVARGWAPGANSSVQNEVWADVHAKEAAMERQAPDTGAYMNEADRLDPNWKKNFYGAHYGKLASIKQKYDPHRLLKCWKCVGFDDEKDLELERFSCNAKIQTDLTRAMRK